METKAMLFSLIKEEIFGSNENAEIPSAHWEKVYALACLHDLGHIPASALERKGAAGQDELSQRMFKTQMTALYRYELNCHELKAICRVLTEEQIPHMLLKGSVIRDLYPKPYLRTSCDIDLLVKEEDLAKSAAALEAKLGYTASKEPAFHDLSMYSPSGVHLELHFNLLEHSMPMDSVLSRVWEFSLLREGYTYVQEAAFLLFHTVAHMAYHFSHGGCGIKPFMDLKLLHDKADYDKEVFSSLCRQAGLGEFYEQALRLCEVWFGAGTHTPLTLQMEAYLLRGGVYGSTENHVALERQRAGGKLRYALKRIWMPREQMELRYPRMKKSVWLFPWYQLRRWVETVFGGRLKHAAGEMKANRMISEDASLRTDEMMKQLGL